MKYFVGIDLGTTNSAICSYDGTDMRIWKSPQQNDVTPSAIYIDRRGNKQIGFNAYNMAPQSPDNSAILFKRLMGTNTPIHLSAIKKTMSPEECSAEILKALFGYLPEEIRNNKNVGTVITVPAAFNQMQKDATMKAAELAKLGKVALMQEPVAAVMSVMRARKHDGIFLVYDLGGGTLDIAIAESIGGRVNLLAHGGISMCGGRDFDRVLFDNIVRPWLIDNFSLPSDIAVNPNFKSLIRLAIWATERAKIELSSKTESMITLSENEVRLKDLNGNEIYVDILLKRDIYDKLIADRVEETIQAARNTLNKAGLSPHDLDSIVFVGGPTNYKPLRDKVGFELGIACNTDVNPMTAVAEGASLFAESINWDSENRTRKNTRGRITPIGKLAIAFNYIARTPDKKAKIAIQLGQQISSGAEFQIDNMDTGWTSGRLQLKHGAIISVDLTKNGENTFKAFVFDPFGRNLPLEQDKIIITKTAATIDGIPASHSISIEVLEKIGGRPTLQYLIKEGDLLPHKGKLLFKSAQSLKAGDSESLNFKLWEGNITDPIYDNRLIGVLKVTGTDFDSGVIPAGGDLECDFEILDSGNILLDVTIPDIKGIRSGNFYSWQGTGGLDYSSSNAVNNIIGEGEQTVTRINEIQNTIQDPKLDLARKKLASVNDLHNDQNDPEKVKEVHDKILEAKVLLSEIRKGHLKEIRQAELDSVVKVFDEMIRKDARPSEISAFDNLTKTAQRSIDRNDTDFESHLDDLQRKSFMILLRQDWFIIEQFKWLISNPRLFTNQQQFEKLEMIGMELLRTGNIEKLREVNAILVRLHSASQIFDVANIIRG